MAEVTQINLRDYIQKMEGNGREYIPVAPRIIKFWELHPDWAIDTRIVELDLNIEKKVVTVEIVGRNGVPFSKTFGTGYAIIEASIYDETNRLRARDRKQETQGDFADFLEKATTGAVGRAVAQMGIGTLYAREVFMMDDINDPVDAPQDAAPQAPSDTAPKRGGRKPKDSEPTASATVQDGVPPAAVVPAQTPQPPAPTENAATPTGEIDWAGTGNPDVPAEMKAKLFPGIKQMLSEMAPEQRKDWQGHAKQSYNVTNWAFLDEDTLTRYNNNLILATDVRKLGGRYDVSDIWGKKVTAQEVFDAQSAPDASGAAAPAVVPSPAPAAPSVADEASRAVYALTGRWMTHLSATDPKTVQARADLVIGITKLGVGFNPVEWTLKQAEGFNRACEKMVGQDRLAPLPDPNAVSQDVDIDI